MPFAFSSLKHITAISCASFFLFCSSLKAESLPQTAIPTIPSECDPNTPRNPDWLIADFMFGPEGDGDTGREVKVFFAERSFVRKIESSRVSKYTYFYDQTGNGICYSKYASGGNSSEEEVYFANGKMQAWKTNTHWQPKNHPDWMATETAIQQAMKDKLSEVRRFMDTNTRTNL